MKKDLPESIRKAIEGLPYTEDTIGKSGSRVLMFESMVLKIEPASAKTAETVRLMRWLCGKLPAPQVLAFETRDGVDHLLMTRVRGKMACHTDYLSRPSTLIPLLAEALHTLWRTGIADCPRVMGLDTVLKEARFRVENGLVEIENTEPDTFGPGGFASPEKLLQWLEDNRPEEKALLTHGDFCLPNLFFDGDHLSGFIDLGGAGVGDPWRDIALCWRSLRHNTDGTYGSVFPGYTMDRFFDALGIAPDAEKLRYYTLLDELF